jgi:S1-C subfamily serine protease
MTISHTRWTLASAACAAVVLAPIFSNAQSSVEAGDNTGRNLTKQAQSDISISLPSFAPLAEHVLPAVVNISVEVTERAAAQDEGDGGASPSVPGGTPFDQFMRRFFNNPLRNPGEKTLALGSGFVIDPAGYVVTNNHVVANAQKVNVTFQDNIQHQAKVLGRDERTDLALLKLDTNQQLPYAAWGNSDDAKVGDWVVAVGNPFGLGGTVTAGIISALGRNINEGPYDDFLQIDAPINRGNSGGPTFDLHGRVIGINTAIYSPSGIGRDRVRGSLDHRQECGRPDQGARPCHLGLARGHGSERHLVDRQEPRPRPEPPDRCAGGVGQPGQPCR